MSDIFRTLIVKAADAPLAREIAVTLSPSGGSNMWVQGLSPTGEPPATHYVSTGLIGPDFAALVPCTFWELDEAGDWVQTGSEPGNAGLVVYACAAAEPPLQLTAASWTVATFRPRSRLRRFRGWGWYRSTRNFHERRQD